MSVKLIYKDVAPGAAEDAEVSVSGELGLSTPEQLPFGTDNALYATAEHNQWTLNGSYAVHGDETLSFWSEALTGDDRLFETPPVITLTFDERYTSLGVSFVFGGDAWCDSVHIDWYQGETQLAGEDFTPDALQYFCERTVRAYDKIVVTVKGTSLPRRRAKIDAILFGVSRTFLRDELRSGSASIVEEIDPTSRELAANAMDWRLSSKNAIEYIFQFKQPVYAYDGDTLIGVFYIDDSERLAERIYDITCTDAIGVLDHESFPDAYYSGANALTLAEDICAGFTVEMQSELQSRVVKGVIQDKTRRGALQQLCFALGAVADTSGTDTIKIFTLSSETPVEIAEGRTRTGGSVKVSPLVTEVRLTAHSYSTSGENNEIEINGVKYYDTQTVVSIKNPDATPSDKANVVDISDATLISPDNVQEIAQHLYDHYARRYTHALKFRLAGETMGDYVQTVTPWETNVTGHYTKGMIRLSGFALTDAEVIGA